MELQQLFRRKSITDILSAARLDDESEPKLKRTLRVSDITSLGIAAIIGAGIFSTVGNAAYHGGPAVILLFLFTGIACALSALCYAEFASAIPIAGSAYTYTYAAFGELMAWVIGWDLLMEYAISNIIVAISWSGYFVNLLARYGWIVPKYLTIDFMTAYRGHKALASVVSQGSPLSTEFISTLPMGYLDGYYAWVEAPRIFNFPLILNLPAILITIGITWIAYIGIRESKKVSNYLVFLKLAVIFLVVVVGAAYIRRENWIPFTPNGPAGVLKGISSVFFAFIGFDALSTTAEECKNPQKDLPRAMILSIFICTAIYCVVALVLTGMMHFSLLGVSDPLAHVFGPEGINIPWIASLVSVIGVIALTTVLLVYQLGQPRIWMAMSRDGLLPSIFSSIHPKYRTPWFSTLLTGVAVIVPALFMNLTDVADLTSIGTLFAFSLVCVGSLVIDSSDFGKNRKFRIPHISSRYLYPALILGICAGIFFLGNVNLPLYLDRSTILEHLPTFCFVVEIVGLIVLGFFKDLSLIPVLGLTTCSYLISELGWANWVRLGLWLLVGLSVYFFYGFRNSKIRVRAIRPSLNAGILECREGKCV